MEGTAQRTRGAGWLRAPSWVTRSAVETRGEGTSARHTGRCLPLLTGVHRRPPALLSFPGEMGPVQQGRSALLSRPCCSEHRVDVLRSNGDTAPPQVGEGGGTAGGPHSLSPFKTLGRVRRSGSFTEKEVSSQNEVLPVVPRFLWLLPPPVLPMPLPALPRAFRGRAAELQQGAFSPPPPPPSRCGQGVTCWLL